VITNNRLDKSFGPVGNSAGVMLFLAGLALSWCYLSGIILVLIGGFVGFTTTSALIDNDRKRIKFCNNLFGIIRSGKWISVEPTMKIGIRESNQTYRAFSRGDRALDINKKDFRLVLYDSQNREIMPMKKYNSLEEAKAELITMRKQLGLT
jgi:hypothetical protein